MLVAALIAPAGAFATEPPIAAYSFDEGEGSVAHDASGNGNEGEIEGAEWTTGKYGGALNFDAEAGDVVTVPDSEGLDTEEFTLEAWIRPDEQRLYAPIVAHTAPEGYGYALFAGSDEEGTEGHLFGFINFHQWVNAHAYAEQPPLNAWSHVAVTSDGKEIKLYRNGVLLDERESEEFTADEAPLQIGGDEPFAEGHFFDGKIDEVRVYNRALDAEEVRADKKTAIQTPPSEAPIAAYSFDDGEGSVAHDASGNGNEGEIEGAEWTTGKYGGALNFNAEEGDVVTIPDSEGLDLEEFTLEAWVRPDEATPFTPILAHTDPEGYGYGLYAAGNEEGAEQHPMGFISFHQWVNAHAYDGGELNMNAWTHVAVTNDGKHIALYVNGVLVDERESEEALAGEAPLQIGGDEPFAEGHFFDGKIDEVRVYDRALDAEEVREDKKTAIQTPPSQEPIAAYSFDEGEGETLHDDTGNGHEGTIEGAEWVGGKFGEALRFDGEEDCVTVPSSESLQLTDSFTLETWVRPQEGRVWMPAITKEAADEEHIGYMLLAGGPAETPAGVVAKDNSSWEEAAGAKTLPERGWSHLALTSNGEELRLYVDGELAATEPVHDAQPTTGPLRIGCGVGWGNFKGLIDEVRIYERPLDVEEINEDMDSAIQVPPSEEPLAAYSFDEGEGETAHDDSGGWEGTIEGAEWVPGKFGSALRFNREDHDSVTIPVSPEFQMSSAFTLDAWVKPEEFAYWMPVLAKETPDFYGYTLYAAGETPGTPQGLIANRDWTETSAIGKEALPVGSWSHLALTSDGEHMRLYVDGKLADTAPAFSAQPGEGPLRIGGNAVFSQYFDGSIDDVRIYDRALDEEEVVEDSETGVLGDFSASVTGEATAGRWLTAIPGAWTGMQPTTMSYRWLRCDKEGEECEEIEGARGRRYELADADLGHTVRVEVRAGSLASTISAPTDEILEPEPENRGTPLIFGHVAVGRLISTPSIKWQPKTATIAFQWRRCDAKGESCEDISGANADQYVVQPADAGSTLVVAETGTTTGGSTATASEVTEVVPAPALENTTAPSVSEASTELGTKLTADPGVWSGKGEVTYHFQWERCDAEGSNCAELDEERASSYALQSDDVGSSLRVRVIASSGAVSETATSSPTAAFETSTLSNTTVPRIAGNPRSGRVLEGLLGTWSGPGPVEVDVQWERCDASGEECAAISGATEEEYELTEADVGATIRFEVSEENEAGEATATSTPTPAVAAQSGPAPSLVSPPEISGVTELGESLTASAGVWSGATEYLFQWLRCDSAGDECEPISKSGTEATYELTEGDVGSIVGVEVTAITADEATAYAIAVAGQSVRAAGAPANTAAPSLEGTAEEGEALTATTGSWTGSGPISYGYRWQRCAPEGCSYIPGATSASYTAVREDALHTLRAVVTAKNAAGSTTAVSTPSASVNAASPLDETLPAITGVARSGSTLTAAHGTWNGDPTIAFAYQWQRCDGAGQGCANIPAAEASTYELGGSDVGSAVRVLVTASNGAGEEEASSEPVGPISDSAGPTLVGAPAITGLPEAGAELSAGHGEWEGAEAFSYQWQRCEPETGRANCANIVGATAAAYTPDYADVGSSLRVAVTASGKGGDATAVSAGTEAIEPSFSPGYEEGALKNLTWPSMSGEALEGQTLTADNGTWKSPWPVSYAYRWRRCDSGGGSCANIEGATASTYVLQEGDVGGTVRAVISAVVGMHSHATITKPTAVVGMAKPSNLSAPTITGEAVQGRGFSVESGEWSGSGLGFSYQWQRCDAEGEHCIDIEEGAEEETYWTTFEDLGATVRVVVTASNEAGSTSAASAPSAVVGPSAPEYSGQPEISGQEYRDGTLEINVGFWTGSPEIEFALQWRRCDEEGESCEDIEGATQWEYVAQAADVGHELRVKVIATNEAGSLEATSLPSEVIGPPRLPVLEEPGPAIEGFPYDGREFFAYPGTWSGHEPIEFAFQWQRCDEEGASCEPIAEATEESYLTTGADLGHTLRAKVTATNSSGTGSEVSEASEAITSGAAANVSPPPLSGGNQPGDELEAGPGQWAGSGPIEFTYGWQRCDGAGEECEGIEGASESKYLLTEEDARKTVRAVVTATGPHGGEVAHSEALHVVPVPSENLAPPTIAGTALQGDTLTASPGEWSPDPDHYSYQWERCSISGGGCTYISGATSETRELNGSDVRHTIRVLVWAENEGESSPPSAVSDITEIVSEEAPTNVAAPSLGTPVAEQKLTANPGTWIGPAPITYEYEWELCLSLSTGSCSWIPTAEGQSYVPPAKYTGQRLRVWVTAQNEHGYNRAVSAISEPIAKGSPSPPNNETPPSLLGEAVVGGLVQAEVGTWTNASFWTFEWERCDGEGKGCSVIPKQIDESYTPVSADLDHTLRAVVTGYGPGGESAVATEPSEPVAAASEPVEELSPRIEGTAEIGQTLSAEEGEWGGSPWIQFEYTWKRCDSRGRHCEAIPYSGDAAQVEYAPTDADGGRTIRLQVTATNGWGSVTATSRPTEVLPAAPPLSNLALPGMGGSPKYHRNFESWPPAEWTGVPILESQWQRCDPLTEDPETEAMECTDIAGATDAGDFHPQIEDIGYKLRLKQTATAPGESQTVYSAPTTTPVSVGVSEAEPTYSGVLAAGATISVSSGIKPQADLPVTTDYEFSRLGGEGPEELQDGPSPELELTEADIGDEIEVSMTVSIWRADEAAVVETRSSNLRTGEVEAAPTNDTLPAIAGEPVVGGELSAEAGEWHGGGGPLGYSYQWRRCDAEGESCTDIAAATKATYSPGSGDLGSTLRIAVSASSGTLSQTASSAPSAVVGAAVAPANETAPAISGEFMELATVEVSPGTWSGSEVLTYSYQWQGCESATAEDCLDIDGATGSTLALNGVEVGQWLRVLVTVANGGGQQTSASELVGPVEAAPAPEPLAAPSLTVLGPPAVGSTLATDGGEWSNAATEELDYQWLRCEEEKECEAIEAANNPTYQLEKEDVGTQLEVEVTASNTSGEVSITSGLSPEISESIGSLDGKIVMLGQGRQDVSVATYQTEEEALPEEEGEPSEHDIADCESLTGKSECFLRGPTISPNGEMVAVEEHLAPTPAGEGTIYLMNFDGSDVHVFGKGSEPKWSADGSELYFTVPASGEGEPTEMVAARVDGSNAAVPRHIPGPSGSASSPSISPNGDLMAYAGREAKDQWDTIYIAKSDGSSPRRLDLAPRVSIAFNPVFSADGKEIIFDGISAEPPTEYRLELGLEFGLERLWAMKTDGSDLHPLVPISEYAYGPPSVGPTGILVSKRKVTYIIDSGGYGIEYGDPEVMHLQSEGADPQKLTSVGLEPDYFSLFPNPTHFCRMSSIVPKVLNAANHGMATRSTGLLSTRGLGLKNR